MSRLATLSEEPFHDEAIDNPKEKRRKKKKENGRWMVNWVKSAHSSFLSILSSKSDLQILLSVLGCPLFPVSLDPVIPINHASSSAQYIIQHFAAATGCRKLEGTVKSIFATGKVRMGMVEGAARAGHGGCFVMWEMVPEKWLIELAVGGQKIVAGSDGKLAWRHTPWLGAHAAKGSLRPLRRALQGLDPMVISAVFSAAQFTGEKRIWGVDCFVLKLSADQADLAHRSDPAAEMIRHVAVGYFSQRSGLLVHLQDSYLTRIQPPESGPTYWETTISSVIGDYRAVEGVLVAHAGESTTAIARFGDDLRAGLETTRMRESWAIDDVAFNVPGLSTDTFIPPAEVSGGDSVGDSVGDGWRRLLQSESSVEKHKLWRK